MICLRNAEVSDLPTIVAIYNDTISSRMVTGDLQPVSVDSRKQWFYSHDPLVRPLWVVESESTVVGWLGFQSFYGRAAYQFTAEVSIYITNSHHRQGLGQYLLGKAICQSPSLGIKTLLGFIFAHNHPSLQLFQKFGFERWGYLPGVAEMDGMERDLVIVGLRI